MQVLQRCDLRLVSSVNDVSGIPTMGKSLIIVAVVDHVLYFRIFDDDGRMVVNSHEIYMRGQARQIEALRKHLESLWPPHELTENEKVRVIAAVASIFGRGLLQKLIRFARKSPREQFARVQSRLVDWGFIVPRVGNDRTAYFIGLFGTGRVYLNELILENIGERANYLRNWIPHSSKSDIDDLQRACHNEACFRRSGLASRNEPYIGSGRIEIRRFDFSLSSSPRFVADKLDLVAAKTWSRQDESVVFVSQRLIRTQTIYVPTWIRIFVNSRPLPKATLIF